MKTLMLVAKSSSKLDFSLAYSYLCGMKLRAVKYTFLLATLIWGVAVAFPYMNWSGWRGA